MNMITLQYARHFPGIRIDAVEPEGVPLAAPPPDTATGHSRHESAPCKRRQIQLTAGRYYPGRPPSPVKVRQAPGLNHKTGPERALYPAPPHQQRDLEMIAGGLLP